MVGFGPPTQTQNLGGKKYSSSPAQWFEEFPSSAISTQTPDVRHAPVLKCTLSPAHLIEESQSPLNPTDPLNVLHHNGIDEVDVKSNPVSDIGELDLQEGLLAIFIILKEGNDPGNQFHVFYPDQTALQQDFTLKFRQNSYFGLVRFFKERKISFIITDFIQSKTVL